MTMEIKSDAFEHNGPIPRMFTCEGDDISPPLSWIGVPEKTKSLVLIVDDPDAPDPAAPKMTWVHWVVYNLPPDLDGLPMAVNLEEFPAGTLHGVNDWRRVGYGGPCPPTGSHRYFYKLFALDETLDDLGKPSKTELLQAMEGHVIDSAELIGTYKKSR